MTRYGLHGSLRATEGNGEALTDLLLDAAAAVQQGDGCQLYLVSRDPADAELVWVTEVWTDRESHDASLQDPATIEMIVKARPIIAGFGDRSEFVPVGGTGIKL